MFELACVEMQEPQLQPSPLPPTVSTTTATTQPQQQHNQTFVYSYPGVAKRVVQVEQIFRDIEDMCFLRTGEGMKSVMKTELTVVEAIMQASSFYGTAERRRVLCKLSNRSSQLFRNELLCFVFAGNFFLGRRIIVESSRSLSVHSSVAWGTGNPWRGRTRSKLL